MNMMQLKYVPVRDKGIFIFTGNLIKQKLKLWSHFAHGTYIRYV